jgi:hypothetical protein
LWRRSWAILDGFGFLPQVPLTRHGLLSVD